MMPIWKLLAAAVLATSSTVALASPVTLDSEQGPLALGDLPGQLQVIGLGYTRCPDTCPAMLTQMKTMLRQLGPHAQRVKAVFVSVDYLRDTPASVGAFAARFSSEILGLAGDQRQVERLRDAYPVRIEVSGTRGSDPVIDHSTDLLVLRHGELVSTLPSDLAPEVMAALIIDQLASVGIGKQ